MRDTVLLRPVNCTFFMQLSIIEDETLILVATVNITSKPIATIFFLYVRMHVYRHRDNEEKRHKISGSAGHFLTT